LRKSIKKLGLKGLDIIVYTNYHFKLGYLYIYTKQKCDITKYRKIYCIIKNASKLFTSATQNAISV
jgi:hypothetical protein